MSLRDVKRRHLWSEHGSFPGQDSHSRFNRELVYVARPLGPRGMLVSRRAQLNRLKCRVFERKMRDDPYVQRNQGEKIKCIAPYTRLPRLPALRT